MKLSHCIIPCTTFAFLMGAVRATTIEAVIRPTEVIRDDIGRHTFGAGVDFPVPQFAWLMDTGPHADGPRTPAQQEIKNFNLGMMRFPSGDGAQLYFWDDPQHSIPNSNPKDLRGKWLTQAQMLKFTLPSSRFGDGLAMDRLFQVNSCQYLDYDDHWKVKQVNAHFHQHDERPEIDPVRLERVAARAAAWVEENNGRSADERVDYWEVGNEDWIHWTGAQYGKIFDSIRRKMVERRSGIKMLAQGLSADFKTRANGTNTMENWIEGLKSTITNPATDVYAYSDHQYVNADEYRSDLPAERRVKQLQDMCATVAAGQRTADLKKKLASSPLTAPWKIWITEFNTYQRVDGKLANPQDMAQALVIADWTGKMLEQNVERMFFHSLDHHPYFTLIQYVNEGGSIEAPRVTPPGYAYTIFPQEFGKKMVATVVGTSTFPNPMLTAPNGKEYPQLGIYSSIREDDLNGGTLRVIVINRAVSGVTDFNLKVEDVPGGRSMKNAPAKYTRRQLRSANLTDSNCMVADAVSWTAPAQYDCGGEGIMGAVLEPASVNLFIIPLR